MDAERVAIVTGSSRGIGRGIAKALAEHAWHLVINYQSNRDAAEEARSELEALGAGALVVRADMANSAELEGLVQATLDRYGRIDLLVNNAGIGPRERVDMLRVGEASYDEVMTVNLVVDPEQRQTYDTAYSPAYAGELRVPLSVIAPLPFDTRRMIGRRAAMELFPGAICNLGAGISTGIANLAAEEGFLDQIVLTNEQGLIGGAPASGVDAGAATNYDAMIDQP